MGHIYIAGPMTGLKNFNADAFFDLEARLKVYGFSIKNPAQHDIDCGFDPYQWEGTESLEETGFDIEAAMKWDLEQVRTAFAIVVLPGWENSKGTNTEVDEAIAYSVPIVFYDGSHLQRVVKELSVREAQRHHDGDKFNTKSDKKPFAAGGVSPTFGKLAAGGYVGAGSGPVAITDNGYVVSKKQLGMGVQEALDVLNKKSTYGPVDESKYGWSNTPEEVRTVSASGGEKGVKPARYDLIPVNPLKQIAEHYGVGAKKYDDNQWRKGYEWSKSYAALSRHLNQFWGGEDFDEETGSNHMAAVAWHALALLEFFDKYPEYDDRYVANKE